MATHITTCANCQNVLNESPQTPLKERAACPNCGSKSRCFKVHVESKAEVKSSLKLKALHEVQGKLFIEQKSGASFFHKAQKWVRRLWRIDRDNDKYQELVVDPETNEVIHRCEEPLSKHSGHGSAKKKTSKNTNKH